MKHFNSIKFGVLAGAVMILAYSCKKDATSKSSTTTSSTSAVASSDAIFVSTVAASSTDTTKKDSVYAIGCFPKGGHADSVAFSSLPASIGTYLTVNYSGYTFKKAFKTVTKSGTADGYVVLITYNGNHIGIKFDASGTFVAVLEQKDRKDLGGPLGFHPGGPFGDRNGMHQDTVAISALPATIASYFTTNYPADTLLHAVINPDSSYTVFSADKGLFATSFSKKLAFINRVQLLPPPGRPAPIAEAKLPAAITTYLTTTYPGYVFDRAFSLSKGGAVDKYVVLIEANNTRYAVVFDGSGTFVKSVAVR